MRFFTRKLYDGLQEHLKLTDHEESERSFKTAGAAWDLARRQCEDYLLDVRATLPSDILALVESEFHDAVVVSATFVGQILEIVLDTTSAPWSHIKPRVRLRFAGVTGVTGMDGIAGEWLLYDELFVGDAYYEYSVLLSRVEMSVRFRNVAIYRD